ncbi:MAG: DUF1840 domain-containing protein [Pseudomonadota bacterium]
MLITFTTKVHHDVVMFGDIATVFLRVMGESEQPPGILRGDDINKAADKLRSWIEARAPETTEADGTKEDDTQRENPKLVSLKNRALPLLELMDAAARKQTDVIWR